jgi:phosphonate metabolism protein PhnN/1,5-bisphosphokinase (PRPP-forming)
MTAATRGWLVLVVGPSGAGKDTLMRAAAERLVEDHSIVFARRIVTRLDPHPGEDSIPMTEAAFAETARSGGFLIHWAAHGLHYGIDSTVLHNLASGRTVVVNVSRTMIGAAEAAWPLTVVVHITASRDVLAARIAARGRETVEDAAARLSRDPPLSVGRSPVIEIQNDGAIATGADRLVGALLSFRSEGVAPA